MELRTGNRRTTGFKGFKNHFRVEDNDLVSINEKEQREALDKYYKRWDENQVEYFQEASGVGGADQEEAAHGHLGGPHGQPLGRNHLHRRLLARRHEQRHQPNHRPLGYRRNYNYFYKFKHDFFVQTKMSMNKVL